MAASTGKTKVAYGPNLDPTEPPVITGAGGGGGRSGMLSSYDMPSGREGVGVGRTGGYSGPTYRGDGYKVSAGVGPRGSVGIGGKVRFKKGGSTASKRADGCAVKGKTKGRMV